MGNRDLEFMPSIFSVLTSAYRRLISCFFVKTRTSTPEFPQKPEVRARRADIWAGWLPKPGALAAGALADGALVAGVLADWGVSCRGVSCRGVSRRGASRLRKPARAAEPGRWTGAPPRLSHPPQTPAPAREPSRPARAASRRTHSTRPR